MMPSEGEERSHVVTMGPCLGEGEIKDIVVMFKSSRIFDVLFKEFWDFRSESK